MAIKVRKRQRETTGSLLRRFSKRVKQSGVLKNARKNRFYVKGKSKRQLKLSARRREQLLNLRKELMKSGQLREGQLIPKDQIKIYEIKSRRNN